MAKRKKMDETEYIMSSPAMVRRLEQSMNDIKEGKGIKIDLDKLWGDESDDFKPDNDLLTNK
jgi:hypothetical protein